jgi:hypothetical protein
MRESLSHDPPPYIGLAGIDSGYQTEFCTTPTNVWLLTKVPLIKQSSLRRDR